jgi:hypothetical protein
MRCESEKWTDGNKMYNTELFPSYQIKSKFVNSFKIRNEIT